MSGSDVLITYHYADASEEVKALEEHLRTKFSVLRTYPINDVIKMNPEQLEEAMLSCNSMVIFLSAGAFETDKEAGKSLILRKYLKPEIVGDGSNAAPVVKPLFQLPRLLRRFIRSKKPVIVYELSGKIAPPASGLKHFKDTYDSISPVKSKADVLKALISKGIKPNINSDSRPLFVPSNTGALTDALKEENSSLTERVSTLDEEVYDLSKQVSGLNEQCTTLKAEKETLKRQLKSAASAEKSDLSEQVSGLNEQISILQAEKERLKSKATEDARKVKEAEKAHQARQDALQAEIEQLKCQLESSPSSETKPFPPPPSQSAPTNGGSAGGGKPKKKGPVVQELTVRKERSRRDLDSDDEGGTGAYGQIVISTARFDADDLPDVIQDMFDSLTTELKKSAMRLLNIKSVMRWETLKVFEEVGREDCLEIPYSEVTDDQWNETLVLSWRWGHQKPLPEMKPGFSPMTDEQWTDLKVLLDLADAEGMVHVWIDWSCVPQYIGNPMVEIQRSRLYYARSAVMAVLSTFTPLDDGAVKAVLGRTLRVIKKEIKATEDADEKEAKMKLVAIINGFLDRSAVSSREYFQRAWTLAERMARHGRNESLSNWMSLTTWIGMLVDAMIKSTEDSIESAMFKLILGEEGTALLEEINEPLSLVVESGAVNHKSVDGLEIKVAELLNMSVAIWAQPKIHEEGPERSWLNSYLTQDLPSGMFKAWDMKDLVWAIYSYFSWKVPVKTDDGLIEAAFDLAQLAGLSQSRVESKVLPSLMKMYKALGINHFQGKRLSDLIRPFVAKAEREVGMDLGQAAAVGNDQALRTLLAAGADTEMRNTEYTCPKCGEKNFNDPNKYNCQSQQCQQRRERERQRKPEIPTPLGNYYKRDDDYIEPPPPRFEQLQDGKWGRIDGGGRQSSWYKNGTPLMFAAENGHASCVSALIEAGAKRDVMSNDGKNALHFAAENGRWDCVNEIIAAGADVNVIQGFEVQGMTALMFAAQNGRVISGVQEDGQTYEEESGHKECIRSLIEAGANRNAKNEDGKTALDLATTDRVGQAIKDLLRS